MYLKTFILQYCTQKANFAILQPKTKSLIYKDIYRKNLWNFSIFEYRYISPLVQLLTLFFSISWQLSILCKCYIRYTFVTEIHFVFLCIRIQDKDKYRFYATEVRVNFQNKCFQQNQFICISTWTLNSWSIMPLKIQIK